MVLALAPFWGRCQHLLCKEQSIGSFGQTSKNSPAYIFNHFLWTLHKSNNGFPVDSFAHWSRF